MPLKALSSSGIRGTKLISVCNFLRPSFGNQRLLNFEVMAVRDIKLLLRSRLSKIYTYLVIFRHFRSLGVRKSANVNFFVRLRKSVD